MFVKGQPKIAGRVKGTPNKKTVERQQRIASIQASGKDPMTFFVEVLSNPENPYQERFAAAKELLPFMHPRLASIESRRGGMTHEERLTKAKEMLGRSSALNLTRAQAVDIEPVNGSHTPTPGGRVREIEGG